MCKFIKTIPDEPTFMQKGLKGFQFPLVVKHCEVYLVDSSKGHDDFVTAENITHIYYIIDGSGLFEIGDEEITADAGQLIEIPPATEFSYSGKMKLLLIMSPPFSEGKVKITKPNPKVIG